MRKVRHGESTNGKNLGWGSCRWSVYACLYNSLPQFANEVFSKFLITKFRQLCDISVLIEDLHITYEAGPKLNEAKLQGSASSALAWR